jgi:uncharacterized protein (UPF0261 family)
MPDWLANVMVPSGTAQVGCTTLPKVGAGGAVGMVSMTTAEPLVTQVVSEMLRTLKM